MLFIPWGGSATPSLCKYAQEFQTIALETVFAHVSASTSQEQFASAQQSLGSLYLELTERMETLETLHFPAAISGRHRCLKAVYREALLRLQNLALLSAEPAAEPSPPEPRQPPHSMEELLADLDEPVQKNSDEFYIGTDEETPDNGSNS
jgi:hypothetical protein